MSDDVEARVEMVDGQLVLVDPAAEAVFAVVEAHNRGIDYKNCLQTLKAHGERVAHFAARIETLGLPVAGVVIVLLCMDDPRGKLIGDNLMPGHDWQPYRDRGDVPFARGLAERGGIEAWIEGLRPGAGQELHDVQGVAVLVVDHGAIVSFSATDALLPGGTNGHHLHRGALVSGGRPPRHQHQQQVGLRGGVRPLGRPGTNAARR